MRDINLHLSIDSVEIIHDRRLGVKLHVLIRSLLLIVGQEEVFQLLSEFWLRLCLVVDVVPDLLWRNGAIWLFLVVALPREH